MGKSPGKWIKSVLFGKKPSKSLHTKGRGKTLLEKEGLVTSKARGTDLDAVEAVASNPTVPAIVRTEKNTEAEKERSSLAVDELNLNLESSVSRDAPSDEEMAKLDSSATMVQAAFRGYLARRAFRALKGIIRLQALIRGHLVRRQAVATLCCLFGIVKFQAFVRGRKLGSSESGQDMQRQGNTELLRRSKSGGVRQVLITLQIAKLTSNAFVRKLLAPSPTVMPLRLCYDSSEPNSVQNWLDRWSRSCFWKPVLVQTKPVLSKPQRKHANNGHMETETARPKRSVRRIPPVNLDNNLAQASENEKPKRIPRKLSSQPTENVVENPQHELEKVKRNLRKVQTAAAAAVENTAQPEADLEKPVDNGVVQESGNSSDKLKKEVQQVPSKHSELVMSETVLLPPEVQLPTPSALESNNSLEKHEDGQELEPMPLSVEDGGKCESDTLPNGNSNCKEEAVSNEVQRSVKKAANLTKQERVENGMHSSPTVPSYMAATESAKAKLRAQGSPGTNQDGSERSTSTRRHSLSSANSNPISHSPRTQRPGSDRKASNKSDKSTSRDGNVKTVQAEWRR